MLNSQTLQRKVAKNKAPKFRGKSLNSIQFEKEAVP